LRSGANHRYSRPTLNKATLNTTTFMACRRHASQENSLSTLPPASADHFPLAALLWRGRAEGASGVLRAVVLVALGTALLTLSAKVNLPLPYVPMTLQTLAVLMIGAVYGWRLGTATMLAYLAEGASGLPVFAGPVGGLAPLLGPTAGYLIGFVAAAFATGWLSERGWDRSVPRLFVAMGIGHIVILALGFVWLGFGLKLGADKAWLVGVAPFIAGTLVKNALGAALVPALRLLMERRRA
jgi:biotin transport system substrate-specific component